MKWHDDLSVWQERLSQAGGLFSIGAGFVLRSAFDAEHARPRPAEPSPPRGETASAAQDAER